MQHGNTETAYVMESSDAELERLVKQAHLFQGQTRSLLQSIGLCEGMHVLDVGCGPVGILDLLAEQVGARGQVVGIDSKSWRARLPTRDPAVCRAFGHSQGDLHHQCH